MVPHFSDTTLVIYELGALLMGGLLAYICGLPGRGRVRSSLISFYVFYFCYSSLLVGCARAYNPSHPDLILGFTGWAWTVACFCTVVVFGYFCLRFMYAVVDRPLDIWIRLCGFSCLLFLVGWPLVSDWFHDKTQAPKLLLVFYFPWYIYGVLLLRGALKRSENRLERRRLRMVYLAFLAPFLIAIANTVSSSLELSILNYEAVNSLVGWVRALVLIIAIRLYGFIRLDLGNAVRDIFDTMDEPVFLLSTEGFVTLTNTSAQTQLMALQSVDLSDGSVAIGSLFPDFQLDRERFEARLETPLGIREFSCNLTPVIRNEEVLGQVLLLHDVTRSREIDQMKTNFTATVSHEIRTPLTAILGFARMIQKRFQTVVRAEFEPQDKKEIRAVSQIEKNLEIILSEGRRLTKLVDEVLDVSKMETGQLQWTVRSHDMGEVIEHALAAATGLFSQKPKVALVESHQSPMPVIDVDGDRLVQVLLNLLSNAVKFTEAGTVTLHTEVRDQLFLVEVRDTGAGIAEADVSTVFEKFGQVGDTDASRPKGTGLGLPISKQIITYHGGELSVRSTLGEGSTFFFTLPLSRDEP